MSHLEVDGGPVEKKMYLIGENSIGSINLFILLKVYLNIINGLFGNIRYAAVSKM